MNALPRWREINSAPGDVEDLPDIDEIGVVNSVGPDQSLHRHAGADRNGEEGVAGLDGVEIGGDGLSIGGD